MPCSRDRREADPTSPLPRWRMRTAVALRTAAGHGAFLLVVLAGGDQFFRRDMSRLAMRRASV
jgi:hypothetical protein